jgi:flagellar basal-body rod modification protein FlgD
MSSPITASAAAGTNSVGYQDPRVKSKTLNQTDFLKVIVAQLSQQDPFKAADSSKFIQDFMSMGSYQAMQDMTTAMKDVKTQQGLLYAGSLVGKSVTYKDNTGAAATGLVESARTDTDGTLWMTVGGTDYKTSSLVSVDMPPSATTTTTQ